MGFQYDDGSLGTWVRGITERAPATAGVVAVATAVSLAWWAGMDISWAYIDGNAVRGQPWRFVTCALPHVGPLHLLFNAWWMLIFGTTLEPYYGWWRTLGLYVLLAAGSGAAEYAAHVGGVGLSGVAYGAMAYLWLAHQRDPWLPFAISRDVLMWFGIWAVACIVFTGTGFLPVGNVAHAGGALLGACIALAATASGWARVAWWGGVAGLNIAIGLGVTVWRPWVNRGPESASLHEQAALEWWVRKDWARALSHLDAARARGSTDPNVFYMRGVALEHLGRVTEAFASYRAAFRRAPELVGVAQEVVRLARRCLPEAQAAGRHADVIEYAAAIAEVEPPDAGTWLAWGQALAARGKADEARKVLADGSRQFPGDQALRDALASLAAGRGGG